MQNIVIFISGEQEFYIKNLNIIFFCIYSKMNIPDTAFAGMSKYEHTIEKWLSG